MKAKQQSYYNYNQIKNADKNDHNLFAESRPESSYCRNLFSGLNAPNLVSQSSRNQKKIVVKSKKIPDKINKKFLQISSPVSMLQT